MNLLYCGDIHIEDGLIISLLSILRNVADDLNVYVLTMSCSDNGRDFEPLPCDVVRLLDKTVRRTNDNNRVYRIDCTDLFQSEVPAANMATRFTPFCMLRLFADQIPGLPDRLLYLDTDVVCRKDFSDFYDQDMSQYDLAGVRDYYGSWFFHRWILNGHPVFRDYLNSGVMLLNMARIRENGLFTRCRALCTEKKMFMPDQTALNKLCRHKKICDRHFNEQRRLHKDTVLQHFTTHFRFFPKVRTESVKPWDIDAMHDTLHLHEYDLILEEYSSFKAVLEEERAGKTRYAGM